MKVITLNLVLILFFTNCSQFGDPQRNPSSFTKEQLSSSGDQKFTYSSKVNSGIFAGFVSNKEFKKFNVEGCDFSIEKGSNFLPINPEETYRFQKFNISVTGKDKSGSMSFESVNFTYADKEKSFEPLSFEKSFSRDFKNILESNSSSKINAVFDLDFHKSAVLTLKKTEKYNPNVSVFFKKGEKREYTLNVLFSEFSDRKVEPSSAILKVVSKVKGKSTVIMDFSCKALSMNDQSDFTEAF